MVACVALLEQGESVAGSQRAEDVVARALARLRPEDRELVQLVEWERMAPAEVAVVLGVRPGEELERMTRLELATSTLGRSRSTN